jgi:arylsulfatase A-like enzyme
MAVREGDFKLLQSSEDGHLELYNLANDLGEQQNLVDSLPEKAKDLKEKLHAWRTALGARQATPNPEYDPQKQHLLDPGVEGVRQRYLPTRWPPRNGKRP